MPTKEESQKLPECVMPCPVPPWGILVVPAACTPATGRCTSGVPSSGWCGTVMTSHGCPTTADMAFRRLASASCYSTSGGIVIRRRGRWPDVIIPPRDGLNGPMIFRGAQILLAAPGGYRLDQAGGRRRQGESACPWRRAGRGRLYHRLRRATATVNVTALLWIIDDRRIVGRRTGVSRS